VRSTSQNVKVVEKFFDDLRDPARHARAFDVVAPDFVAHEARSLPFGGDHHGPEGFRLLLRDIGALLKLDVRGVTICDAGDLVMVDVDAVLTCRRNGRVLDTRIVELYRVENGLMRRGDVFYQDTKALIDAVNAE
jgi:ketosteroid isomerase-like protein